MVQFVQQRIFFPKICHPTPIGPQTQHTWWKSKKSYKSKGFKFQCAGARTCVENGILKLKIVSSL